MKVFFRNIHLYLGLAAGIFIIISCLSGAILVFEDEIEHLVHEHRYRVEQEGKRKSVDSLVSIVLSKLPKAKIISVKVFSDPYRTAEIGITIPDEKEEKNLKPLDRRAKRSQVTISQVANTLTKKNTENKGQEKKGGGKPTLIAFVNPYTADVIEVFNPRTSFFFQVEMLHRWLLGGKDSVGNAFTGISTFIFLFILITGLILWWPKNKKILRQRIKVKWNSSFKRLNHDLHIVLGFYSSILLVIIVVTGLVMSYNWINKGIFTLTRSKMENPEPPNSVYIPGKKPLELDKILKIASTQSKSAIFYSLRLPKDSIGAYSVSFLMENKIALATQTLFIDQYSGSLLSTQDFNDKNTGQKIRAFIKPVHTGEIFGLPTKILSFLICLVTITFPITGVIMWLNRLKINKR